MSKIVTPGGPSAAGGPIERLANRITILESNQAGMINDMESLQQQILNLGFMVSALLDNLGLDVNEITKAYNEKLQKQAEDKKKSKKSEVQKDKDK